MSLKAILFILAFVGCAAGALAVPLLGVLGYAGVYCVGPDTQWWNAPLRVLGIRYSYVLALVTAVGIAINWRRLEFCKPLLLSQEKLLLVFLAVVWLSLLIGEPTVGRYEKWDHPSLKVTKIAVFTMMLTHVVGNRDRLKWFLWVLVGGALLLGLRAFTMSRSAFSGGRLEGIGGPDFVEANYFGAFCATMVPLIGVQFLRTGWLGRALCLAAGVFTVNAIVLTRSRGAVVGLALGAVVAVMGAPKKHRVKIILGMVVVLIGGLRLADPQFISRTATITSGEESRDASAQSRIVLTEGGLRMLADHPLGIGAGNWYQTVGRYLPQYPGKDAHNTYMKCVCELGIQGALVFGALIVNAFWTLRKVLRQVDRLPAALRGDVTYLAFGIMVSLAVLLGCCLTMTLLYVEFLWWILMLPVCLERVVASLEADHGLLEEVGGEQTVSVRVRAREPAPYRT
jgi:O-antigen ligase